MTTAIKTTICLDAEQMRRLKECKDRTGAPVSELIRRAIDAYLPEPQIEFSTREEVSR